MTDDLIPNAPEAPQAPEPPSLAGIAGADGEPVVADPAFTPVFAEPIGGSTVDDAAASPHQTGAPARDSMSRPPTDRYPGARPSPRTPTDAEHWVTRPAEPATAPRRTLPQRLWWVLPFGCSLLAGLAFVGVCALRQQSGHPDFLGTACAVATIAALLLGVLLISDDHIAALPTHPVLAACIALFGVPPAVTWILLALR